MAINKKLITFDKKSTFLGANGINNVSSPTDGYYHNIPEWSMVFILETGEIWHNGKYFGKPIKDQIFPATSQLTKGIVFMNNDDYYYRSFNLWGNVFDGSVRDINGELVVQGETYKWTYGDGVIRKGNANLIAFSGLSGVYDVFIPSGDLSVTGGDLKVGNNITLASTGSIKGTHILNTNSYFNLDYSLGKTWNSIKLFNTSGTLISLDSTRPAIINIQAGVYASGTNWQPWITGGDVTELSSWGIGLGGDAFYIGRIDKTNTENSLSQYWKFDSEDGITISGTTKYIKVADLSGASEKIFLADGTVKALSELMSDAVVGEATTTNYGGFKLTQNKSSVQQTLVSNTTGNGRYAVKMNADGTLFVEFVLANTWLPATNTLGGYIPQLSTGSDTIDSNLNDYVLTFTSSDAETITPTWRRLPSSAFENTWREIKVNGTQKRSTATNSGDLNFINGTNTSVEWTEDNKLKINAVDTWNAFTAATSEAAGTAGYIQAPAGALNKFFRGDNTWLTINLNVTSALYVGASNGTGNSAQSTNGNVYLIFAEGSSYSRYKIVGSGRASVTSDVSGNITINSSGYSNFGAATASAAGSSGLVPAPGANVLGTGGYFLRADGSWVVPTNTWKAANSSQEGYVPKLNGSGTIGTQSTEYVLTFTSGGTGTITPTWKLLPANAFVNTWTAWKGATDSANGTAGYMPAPTSAQRGKFLRGDGSWVSLNNYSLPTASKDTLGGVKTGAAITDTTGYTAVAIKDGVIYYKDTNTTYSFSNLLFQQTSGTNLMTYNSQAVRTVLAGSNITFTHSNNVLTIAAKDTTYSTVSKTAAGLCPTLPNETTTTKYLRLDGSWLTPPDNNTWKAANSSLEGYVPKSKANKILRTNADGALYWGDDANTTYTFYNLLFQNSGGTTVDTYKPTTSPTKTLKAGSNVTISAASNVITIASTNTWNANAVGVAGYVAAPTKAANANMTWLTNSEGVPAWRASNNHSHAYLPTGGGTMTGNITFSGDNNINWTRNTDSAKIHFKNTGDGDSDSYLGFETADNGNEYFKFGHTSGTYTEWMSIKSDGVRVKGTLVSLNGHNHAYTDLTGSGTTANLAILSNGTANGWKLTTLGARAFDSTSYLPLSGGTLTGNVTCTTSGANLKWGNITIYGGGSNGGSNSIYIGDDVTLGDCNVSGSFGMKSTGANAGLRFFNSSGTSIGGIQSTAGTLQWINSAGTAYNILDASNSSVSLSGSTLSVKINGTTQSLTNTWRGILNNLTSSSNTTESLSAKQGYLLANGSARDNTKLPLSGGTMTGSIIMSQGASARNVGIIGTYDPDRAAAIWSMGSSYLIPADGTSFGSLYGAAYAYFGSGHTFGAGYSNGHSLVWCLGGSIYAALGNSIWSRGGFIKNGSSDSYILLGGGGHKAVSDFWPLFTDSYPCLRPGSSNNWILIGTSNTSYGILPSTSGGAGSGHNYIGTSSWYWKYAYIDLIYGYLNGNISGDADTVDGEHATAFHRNLGGANYVTINVGGNANTYYPVVISSPSSYYPYQFVSITRTYSETAPDTWNTSTHKGGLSMAIFWNGSSYWDGNSAGSEAFVVRLYQSYSTMVGGVDNAVGGKVVWLRGGGANYHIFSMNGTSQSATVYLSTYTDSASRSFAPKTTPDDITVRWPGYANGADYATSAGSASSVAWSNVSSKPATATRWPSWSEVTDKPSTFTPSSHTHDYLPLAGGTMTGNITMGANSIIFNQATTSSWNVAANTGITLLNTVGASATGAPGTYSIGLSVSGYYGFLLAAHGGGSRLLFRNTTRATYPSWSEIAYLSDVTWATVTSKPATATRWPTWSEVTGKPSTFTPSSHTHNYIEAKGNYTFTSSNLPNTFDLGISAGFVNSNSGFGSYGSVLTVRTYSGGGGTLQLYAPYGNSYGGNHLKARFGDYGTSSGNSWTALKTIAWLDDIPSTITWANVTSKPGASGNATTPVYWNGSGFTKCTAYGSASVNYANSAGNADTVDSQHFKWSNDSNSPTYLWAANSSGTAFLCARGSMSVNYANSAGNADTVGSYGLSKLKTRLSNYKLISGGTSAAGWYRILDCTTYSMTFLITFYGGYNYCPPTPVTFLVSHSYSVTTISQIGKCAYTGWITSLRAVHHDTYKFYIDVYFAISGNTNAGNPVAFEVTPLDPNYTSYTLIDYTKQSNGNGDAKCDTSTSFNVDYASSAGSVAWSNISSKPETATRWPSWSEVTSKPSTFTPSSHTHAFSLVTDGTCTSTTSGWSHVLSNTYGGSLKSILYMCHGGGYGMHLRGYSTSASVYMLLIYNSSKEVLGVYGDGHSVFGGNVTATHFYESSDIRLKHDIFMMSKSIRKFRFNNDNKLYYGFIAQELEETHPELVDNSGEYKTVNYNSAICYYIAELENRILNLEDKLKKYEDKLMLIKKD